LWEKLGHKGSAALASWPQYDESLTLEKEVLIMVQVNGRIRDKFTVPAGAPKEELETHAQSLPAILKWTEGKTVNKIIVVPDKLVNIVVAD
jgi:leucyl-tRNA synthetase